MPCFIYGMYPAEERSENENGIVPERSDAVLNDVSARVLHFKRVKEYTVP